MLTLRVPRYDTIEHFLAMQRGLPLTYDPAGMTRGKPPAGFNVDHLRRPLGNGQADFERAVAALRSWAMFAQTWVRLDSNDRPPEVGLDVAIIVRLSPVWWCNACRVIYVVDEALPVPRFGFAYGTLPSHAERGEERFLIEMAADGTVWYDLLAYSRPRHWAARLGYPLTRRLQRRFALSSASAMERTISQSAPFDESARVTELRRE